MKCLHLYAASLLILVACGTRLPAQAISPRLTETLPTELPGTVAKEAETPANRTDPTTAPIAASKDETLPQNPLTRKRDAGVETSGESLVPPGLPASSEGTGPTYIMGTNIIIAYSDDKNTIWGFSKVTGKWAKQTIAPVPSGELVPSVASEVAGLQVAEAIYAFSGRTGTWDLLRLPKKREARIAYDDDVIVVTDGESVYTFPATTGTWSSTSSALGADLEKASNSGALQQPVRDRVSEQQIKVFSLMYMSVESAAALIRQMFSTEGVLIAAEARTNALIVSGTQETLNTIEALLLRLDETGNAKGKDARGSRSVAPSSADDGGHGEAGVAEYGEESFDKDIANQEAFEQLSRESERLNLETTKIASRCRQIQDSGKARGTELEELKDRLLYRVYASFGVRQRLQQVELALLRRELHSIQQTINARELMKDKIIERRVSDLLNPQLRWNADTKKAASPNQAVVSPASNPYQADPYAQDEVEDSPLAVRRNELEDRRQRLFEDIVGIELSLIESKNASPSGFIKRLSAEELRRLSAGEKKRFEAETSKTENRILQYEDRKSAFESELKLIEQQLDHIDSRVRESQSENAPMIDHDVKSGRLQPPPTRVVFYHADWCLICESIKPEIKKLEADGLPIVFRDLTDGADATATGVKTVPAFDLWVDGKFKERVEGRDYGPLIEKLRAALAVTQGTSRPQTSTSTSEKASLKVLEAKLAAAESNLNLVETQYRAGSVTATPLAKAKLEVEVLKQQIADSRSRRDAEERLLVIDLKSAQLELEAAAEELAQMEKLRRNTTSAASISELARLRLAVGQAELSVQRAQTKLDLIRSQANPNSNGH